MQFFIEYNKYKIETWIRFPFLIYHKNNILRRECFFPIGHPDLAVSVFCYVITSYCILSITTWLLLSSLGET